jgi:parallel beta-helix repeat protein
MDPYDYHNRIAENNVSDNDCGITLRNSSNNEICQNYISGNREALSIYSSGQNNICENDFQNNTKQLDAYNSDAMTWNTESPKTGNYWSHLNPPDEDKDKIGDVPYKIAENNTDKHPLIYPFEYYESGYKPTPDLKKDGIVNILDLNIVARAYGCIPGDSKWNPTADMDMNEIIDITDVSKVARDFLRDQSNRI